MKSIQAVTYPVIFEKKAYKELSNLIDKNNFRVFIALLVIC